MKRSRAGNKFEARLPSPSKIAGSIIGKSGANIQTLRNEYNANVRVPDCPGPERVMTIHADDAQTCINVVAAALPYMSEEAARSLPGQKPDEQSGPKEIRILIHQSIVGGIIGRAGFKIKEIRDASGANIKVYQTCAPQSTDRCVAVQGALQKIVLALKEVFEVINNTEIKGVDQPYDPINFDGYYACEYGGFGSEMDVYGGPGRGGGGGQGGGMRGSGGGMSRGGGGRGGLNGGFGGQSSFGGGGRGGGMSRGGGAGGRGGYDEGFAGRGGFNQRGGQRGGAGGGGGGGAGGYEIGYNNVDVANYGKSNNGSNFNALSDQSAAAPFSGAGEDTGEQETTQVTIPKDMAGAIIGPGGSRIRGIRSDSKASITIDEPVQGSNERIITITGSQRQIQTAQFLLQQSVREHAGPPPMQAYGGPPGRY